MEEIKETTEITGEEAEIVEHALNEEVLRQEKYVPRPAWQRIAAWVGLGIVIVGVIMYYYHIANGGR
ncbi:MAG: hypothetical protein E7462_02460 [Ruminococcaceae bacterium]|nr:hypothetical protein [Oscillospiraceae bacterium]